MSAGATGPGKWIRSAWGSPAATVAEALVVGRRSPPPPAPPRAPGRWPRTAGRCPVRPAPGPGTARPGVPGASPSRSCHSRRGGSAGLVVGRAVPDDPRLPAPVAGEHVRVGRADRHDLVHAPRPVALAALQQRAPGTRQAREPGALGGQVARVVDRRHHPACAAAARPPAVPRAPLPATRRWGRHDGHRPRARSRWRPRWHPPRPATAGGSEPPGPPCPTLAAVARRARARAPDAAGRGRRRPRTAAAGWAATGTAAAARRAAPGSRRRPRTPGRPGAVRATTVTP